METIQQGASSGEIEIIPSAKIGKLPLKKDWDNLSLIRLWRLYILFFFVSLSAPYQIWKKLKQTNKQTCLVLSFYYHYEDDFTTNTSKVKLEWVLIPLQV